MAFKFVVLATLLAAANAGLIAAPAATSHSYSSSSVSHGPALSYAAPAYKVAAAPVAHYSYAAAPIAHYAAAPVAHYAVPIHKTIVTEQYAPAAYDFEYSVQDPHTGDFKSQKESRQGDAVHGSYSLIEADGSKRIVEYTADDHSGFNAVVHREPAAHPVAAPIVKYAAAPVVKYAAAPVVKYAAAPVVKYASAPVVKYTISPVVKYTTSPVVKYTAAPVAHYAASPVAHYAAAPIAHYAATPVAHYADAPVAHYASAPVAHYAAAPVAHYSAAPSVSYASYAAPTHVLHH